MHSLFLIQMSKFHNQTLDALFFHLNEPVFSSIWNLTDFYQLWGICLVVFSFKFVDVRVELGSAEDTMV